MTELQRLLELAGLASDAPTPQDALAGAERLVASHGARHALRLLSAATGAGLWSDGFATRLAHLLADVAEPDLCAQTIEALRERGWPERGEQVGMKLIDHGADSAAVRDEIAWCNLARHEVAAAAQQMLAAIAQEPTAERLDHLAGTIELVGRVRLAQAARARARSLSGDTPAEVAEALQRAMQLSDQGDDAGALALLDPHAGHFLIDKARGVLMHRLGRAEQAVHALYGPWAVSPDDGPLRDALAESYIDMDELDRAHDVLAQPRPLPTQRTPLVVARLHSARGDWTRAAAVLRTAVHAAPDDVGARALLARALMQAGHLDEARKVADGVLAVAPDHVDARRVAGGVAADRGDLTEAVRLLQPAVTADPSEPVSVVQLANALQALGRPADAVGHLQAAVNVGAVPRVHEQLVNGLIVSGRIDDALARAEALVRDHPGRGAAWGMLALARGASGDVEGAGEALRRALEHPPVPEAVLAIARANGLL